MRGAKFTVPLVLFLFGYGGFVAVGLYGLGHDIQRDYSRRPPDEAFRIIFQRPVPADVQDLAAAGEMGIGGSDVWLRFRASSWTIRSLTAGLAKTLPWKQDEDIMRDDARLLGHYQVHPRTHWSQVWKIRNGWYFVRSTDSTETSLAIDPKSRTVYVFYHGI